MAVIDELLVGLGYDYDDSDIAEFQSDIEGVVNIAKKLVVAATGVAVAITAMVVSSTAASDSQGKLANELGESVELVDALGFALGRAGGNINSMGTSLQQLAIRASEASRGVGSGIETFARLGINVRDGQGALKSTTQLLLEVSDSLSRFSKVEQLEFADKLGLKDSIRLLQVGSDGINELIRDARELGVVTEEDAVAAAMFQDSLLDISKVTSEISRIMTREFVPILQKLVGTFTSWWTINRDIISQNFGTFIDRATIALKLLSIATAVWLSFKLISILGGINLGFTALARSVLKAVKAIISLPFLIGSAITAVALLAEDAKVFFEGGDSFLQSMIDKFPSLTSEIQTAAAVFATIADLAVMAFEGWSQLIDLVVGSPLFKVLKVASALPSIVEGAGGFQPRFRSGGISSVANSVSSSATTVVDKLEIIVQGGVDSAGQIAETVFNAFQQATQDLQNAVDQ